MALSKLGPRVLRFVLVERVISFLTRIIDVWMIYFLTSEQTLIGICKCLFICGPVYLFFCGSIVYINDKFAEKGLDITGLNELRMMAYVQYDRKFFVKRFVSWLLKKRQTILWVGSWFYIDPDYVTLILRRPGVPFWDDFWKVTLPSVCISLVVWTFVYWCGVNGIKFMI